MAATWMARCGINTRIIDKRGTKIFSGYVQHLHHCPQSILNLKFWIQTSWWSSMPYFGGTSFKHQRWKRNLTLTVQIFDSFGFADRVWKESNHMLEICLWNPDSEGKIRRSDRIPDTIPFISRFQQVVLHQGMYQPSQLETESLKNFVRPNWEILSRFSERLQWYQSRAWSPSRIFDFWWV